MKQKQFCIDGMHCSACALNIDLDLEELAGVTKASTNYAKQITEVTYNSEMVSEEQIVASISKSGYRVTAKN